MIYNKKSCHSRHRSVIRSPIQVLSEIDVKDFIFRDVNEARGPKAEAEIVVVGDLRDSVADGNYRFPKDSTQYESQPRPVTV